VEPVDVFDHQHGKGTRFGDFRGQVAVRQLNLVVKSSEQCADADNRYRQ
jgi:hypothetical protein